MCINQPIYWQYYILVQHCWSKILHVFKYNYTFPPHVVTGEAAFDVSSEGSFSRWITHPSKDANHECDWMVGSRWTVNGLSPPPLDRPHGLDLRVSWGQRGWKDVGLQVPGTPRLLFFYLPKPPGNYFHSITHLYFLHRWLQTAHLALMSHSLIQM